MLNFNTKLTKKEIRAKIKALKDENYDLLYKLSVKDEVVYDCLMLKYIDYTKSRLIATLNYLEIVISIEQEKRRMIKI